MALLNIAGEKWLCVVAWHNPAQKKWFCEQWGDTRHVLFVQDKLKQGCAVTKNRGVKLAMELGADCVAVLDDDCGPSRGHSMNTFLSCHSVGLAASPITRFKQITEPASRGTPYEVRKAQMPVAASMGFWRGIGDLDAAAQLVRGADSQMEFNTEPIFGQYFPLCGMNLAFRPRDWMPWCQFIDVPRFDDIWMGWLWQKEAYRRGYCFSLQGPQVFHSRQSNVWRNLQDEARYLERNETLWRDIAESKETDYTAIRKLLPV